MTGKTTITVYIIVLTVIYWILQPVVGHIFSRLFSPAPSTILDTGENIPLKFINSIQYERGKAPTVKELEL